LYYNLLFVGAEECGWLPWLQQQTDAGLQVGNRRRLAAGRDAAAVLQLRQLVLVCSWNQTFFAVGILDVFAAGLLVPPSLLCRWLLCPNAYLAPCSQIYMLLEAC
jgi:hypothetical protein